MNKIKDGMGGSRNGRGRSEKTETLKDISKKQRRQMSKHACRLDGPCCFKKITEGHVVQVFNDIGECISQEFFAGDDVEYETSDGDPINVVDMPLGGREYHPFTMKSPLDKN